VRCGCRSTSCRICRTVRGLMASTTPSSTAWRAKSKLLQWVMCSPLAIGSKQANCTIWARYRGGKLLGAAGARGLPQHTVKTAILVAAAYTPHGGGIALRLHGHVLDSLPASDAQEDLSVLDLKPRARAASRYRFQN